MTQEQFEKSVRSICNEVADMLVEKNKSYGNSALDPINCFYKGDAETAIKVRIDDKLSRIMHGKEYGQEDTIMDLLGYLVILKVSKEMK